MPIYIVHAFVYVDGEKLNNYVYPFYYENKEDALKALEKYKAADEDIAGDDKTKGVYYDYHVMRLALDVCVK